uniref:Kinesin motor domain-containing protein n=1 Tax=Lotharella oceanica TaxID=641309 RepID=A0A7S2U3A0_9EUKA|mmetsp:Transcript_6038/g.12095  ORF Transcript_6038/g.12095 Transcript_6038/m.12095 type:complete len:283 (+) Transcript_6038:1085-1933(+)
MSPATSNVEETAQTLKFAARAKKIKNVVSINEKLDQATLLEKYREEIEGLKRDLAEAKNKIKAEDSNVDKEELRKLHEEREEFKQRIEQLTRIILTSSRTTERDLLDLMPQPESKTERRASMKDKLRRAKFSTLPRTFFSADSATDGELESRTQSSTGRDSSQLDNLDIKPEFETAEGRNNASARFQEMKREIENLKQVILDKELLLTKHEAERKRLATEVEKRDAALREWEAYYQAENNATVAASTVESPKSGDKDDTPGRKKSDLLETKDADFEAPLIDF